MRIVFPSFCYYNTRKKGFIMIYVFKEVDTLDKKCYDRYHMSEDLLMEHAALGLKEALPDEKKKVLIVSGAGNNGADGIALSRLISMYHDSYLFLPHGVKSPMAKLQLERAKALDVEIIEHIEEEYDIVVDALFGSGLSREIDAKTASLIKMLNSMKAYKLSCDIPSGINLEGNILGEAFMADKTVTMGARKEGLYSDEAKEYVGEIVVADLGVARKQYEGKSNTFLLEYSDMQLPHRLKKNTHKGDFGHLSVIAGQKQGAAVLAAKAALAFGAGLVTVVENEPYVIPPELMSSSTHPKNTTAFCIGMGLGNSYDDEYLSRFLLYHDRALLIDADLFYAPIMIEVLKKKNLVITPHPKEFTALLKLLDIADISVEELQKRRFFYVREFANHYPDVVLLLKGANTLISQNHQIYIQPYGTNLLSKGGSGDVLSGLIASLLAQGYRPLEAAISGALAHAFAAKNFTKNSYALTPDDLIEGVKCL
jgi:hydroxyethylthiazole kinase-like uncharacterized protein yjeF